MRWEGSRGIRKWERKEGEGEREREGDREERREELLKKKLNEKKQNFVVYKHQKFGEAWCELIGP